MLSKNKIRRLNPEQLADLSNKDTEPSNLQLCQQFLQDHNQRLRSKKTAIEDDIAVERSRIQKLVIELQDSMKEKLRLKQRQVLNRTSRPTAQNMSKLTSIYTVTQQQNGITERKSKYISKLSEELDTSIKEKKQKLQQKADYSELDQQYQALNKQCEVQTGVLEELIRQRDKYRAHYSKLAGEIDVCRVEYEEVEGNIRQAERELIQLSSYLEDRKREDLEALEQLNFRAGQLEEELLKGQELINNNRQRRKFLEIQMIEAQAFRP